MLNARTFLGSSIFAAAVFMGVSLAQSQQMPHQPGMMDSGMRWRMTGQRMPMSGMMGCPMMGPGMMTGQGMSSGTMMSYGPAVEARLAYLKAELGITDPQTQMWNGYVGAIKVRMSTMQAMHDSMMQAMHAGSAVARMDAHVKHMEAMTETLKALKPATEALYAVLTADQRAKADQLLGMGCCMM